MLSEWQRIPFAQAALINPGAVLQRGLAYAFVDMNAVDASRPDVHSCERRVFTGSGSRFEDGDTLFARITPCLENGKIARYKSLEQRDQAAHGSTEFIVMRGRDGVSESNYVFYLARSTQLRGFAIGQMTGSSGRQRVPTSCFDKLLVWLPPIKEQSDIAAILGALDAKIEQNRRTARALERVARAIFRAWFVDFEPVIAKAAGATAFPSMPQRVFDALPKGFSSAVAGPVPDGWDVVRLDDIVTLQRGFDLPKQSRTEGSHPVFAASGLNGFNSEWKVKGPGVTTGRSGVLGQVFFVDRDFWPLNTSLWVKEYKRSNPWHAYFLLQTLDLARFNAGSAVPTLNRNHVHSLPIVAPPDNLLKAFERVCSLTFSLNQQITNESDKLAAMRDYLLPKLLSGDIRVN